LKVQEQKKTVRNSLIFLPLTNGVIPDLSKPFAKQNKLLSPSTHSLKGKNKKVPPLKAIFAYAATLAV